MRYPSANQCYPSTLLRYPSAFLLIFYYLLLLFFSGWRHLPATEAAVLAWGFFAGSPKEETSVSASLHIGHYDPQSMINHQQLHRKSSSPSLLLLVHSTEHQ